MVFAVCVVTSITTTSIKMLKENSELSSEQRCDAS